MVKKNNTLQSVKKKCYRVINYYLGICDEQQIFTHSMHSCIHEA